MNTLVKILIIIALISLGITDSIFSQPPPPPPGNGGGVPLKGGLSILLIAGISYATYYFNLLKLKFIKRKISE